MPTKGKGHKLEVGGGAKASASNSSQKQKQEEEKLELDEIARACLEIEEQMARQESRPKNRRKKAARQKTEVEGKVKATLSNGWCKEVEEVEKGGGEGVQQLSELNMTGETRGEATRLTELIKISVEVSLANIFITIS